MKLKYVIFALVFLFSSLLHLSFAADTYTSTLVSTTDITGYDLNPCPNVVGEPIVDIVQTISNDVARGQIGQYWAKQRFARHIKIYRTNIDNEYCVYMQSVGKFKGIKDSVSPGLTSVLDGNESGDFVKVAIYTVKSTQFEPKYPLSGYIGEVNYSCDRLGDCSGHQDWSNMYFPQNYPWITTHWIGSKYVEKQGSSWTDIQESYTGDID